ncbi:putative Protein kinase domain containing protein [Blattamonas nauphoetae]|uniref:mitogen-activated protein kinase kinase n=1 Tax=Blattamonas nauphoetae TaxID=2049346 RepID=A0ABQ9X562_9EUKA|nr:putative Protein kinase domain containing protein [Blattamonas nauphoetae]
MTVEETDSMEIRRLTSDRSVAPAELSFTPTHLKTLPQMLFTTPSHFSINHTTITRTERGQSSNGYAHWSSALLYDPFTSGIVSITFSILRIAFCRGSGTIAFGLMKSNSPLPQVGELLGNKVKNSISLNRSGSLWVKTPSSHSLQDCHTVLREGDSVRMEVDLSSTPRTVQFFVNGEAGECYMSGIPSSVRIGSSIRGGGGSFRIDSISRLSQPSPILEGMLEIKWERIDREVNRLRKFAHPGIVGLKEMASMGNMKVIVMEVGGQSLADLVKDHTSRGVLVAREVVYRVMVDVSSALNLMHNHESGSTAHGDVKMENILVFPGGHFKLCDLGAAESEDVSSTRSVMSQLYVSPERMESETGRATCSSDVWALGIVLHWLLFGEPPFTSKSLLKLGQEISSFRVSQIGSDCGGEEPLWRLKDADDMEYLGKEEKWKKELELEKNAHKHSVDKLNAELNSLKEKLTKSESERQAAEAKLGRQEQEHPNIPAMRVESRPGAADGGNEDERGGTEARRGLRRGTVGRSQIGAAVIELIDRKNWTVSGNVFTKSNNQLASLVSFEFGVEVARLSLILRKGQTYNFVVGIISSCLCNDALTKPFHRLKGGAGWSLYPGGRCATQNKKWCSKGSACLEGREGQRVVLEADGREGKRTLKLSQDGETQPVIFTNIPVPFRFAVSIFQKNNAVEIESVEVVSSPQMVGGTIAFPMDE